MGWRQRKDGEDVAKGQMKRTNEEDKARKQKQEMKV